VAFLEMHYPCALDACKIHSSGLHRPLLPAKNEIKAQVLITLLGSMASSVIATSACSFTSTSFSYNIEGIGKLGKGFGTVLPLTPPVRQGDFLCILDLVESLRSCFCAHAGCNVYVQIRLGKSR